MLRTFALSVFFLPFAVFGQAADTADASAVRAIHPVEVHAYFSRQPILGLTSAAHAISAEMIETQQPGTLLPALNAVAGLRMEERSPGSYRLAMRGSLIRSPFGIRNAKIYIDEFPLTDAGGNTYLQLLDPGGLSAVHILKGPDGSLYGANSGGVVRLQPKGFDGYENRAALLLGAGSFGMFQEQLSVQRKVDDRYGFSFDQSFGRADGYRENTNLNKKTFQTAHRWAYSDRREVRIFALYGDLDYRTPGGLTEAQMRENPRASRPAAGPNPGAKEQNAGIRNRTFYGGIAHRAQLTDRMSHVAAVFGSHTDFRNPFITNYEFRKEQNLGLRTYFSREGTDRPDFQWQMQLGAEIQKGWNAIDNYDNDRGRAAGPQAKDDLDNWQGGFFYRAMTKWRKRWTLEGSLGLNRSQIAYRQRFPETGNPAGRIDFAAVWMPRAAMSYLLSDRMAVRGSVSRGYSPPTIAEVRSSDNTVNTDLRAETGTNYELGARLETENRRLVADIAVYRYGMRNGIVRQLRESGAEYFVNAGELDQKGLELSVWAHLLVPDRHRSVRTLILQSAFSYNHYRFGNYRANNNDFSGNKVTAVPDVAWASTLFIDLPKGFGLHVSHRFTSAMPLNDANTVFAEKFHLVQLKASWSCGLGKVRKLQLSAGVDNLLNERYSLGNDINAFGNRFFNPAATRNAYFGLRYVH